MKPQYERMARFLWSSKDDRVSLTFDEIARIVSGDLPKSARDSRESWSNNPGGFGMTRMWLAAGYKTSKVDIARMRVTFERENQGVPDQCWREVVKIALGVDLPPR